MLMMSLALLLAASAPDMAPPAVDGVAIRQTVEHYPIHGDTSRGILTQIQTRGRPNPETGRIDSGYTHAQLNWTYGLSRSAGGVCRAGDAEVRLDLTITLPQWQPDGPAPEPLAAQWNDYADALARHELGHRDRAVTAAVAVRDAIAQLPPMHCDRIRARIDALTSAIVEDMQRDNRRYDEETGHGRSEGAYWIAR